ncbi:MAG: tetratricopeptide repeat protein [Clostridia bacterium]|nr:tetratricopeptide repeat protein [Clostridia bacterium]
MAVLKCKMCGAPLEAVAGAEIIECKYCLTQQTIEGAVDQSKPMMYERGEMLLNDGYFEKAEGYFEKALDLNYKSSDAYLGLEMARCKVKTIEDLAKHYAKSNKEESPELRHAKEFAKDKSWVEIFESTLNMETEIVQANLNDIDNRLSVFRNKSKAAKNLVAVSGDSYAIINIYGEVEQFYRRKESIKLDWKNITSIYLRDGVLFGIDENGTVKCTDQAIQEKISSWTDIVQITTDYPFLALKKDGTVIAFPYDNSKITFDFSHLKNIVQIETLYGCTMALTNEGKVIPFEIEPSFASKIATWENISEIFLSKNLSFEITVHAITKYGEFLHAGGSTPSFFPNKNWHDFVSGTSQNGCFILVKSDGTTCGADFYTTRRNASAKNLENVLAVLAEQSYILAIQNDGNVIIKEHYDTQPYLPTYDEKIFNCIDTINEDRQFAIKKLEIKKRKQEEEAKRQEELKKQQELIASRKASGVCQHCGSKFKGLFTKVCSSCGKKKDY